MCQILKEIQRKIKEILLPIILQFISIKIKWFAVPKLMKSENGNMIYRAKTTTSPSYILLSE